MKHTWMIVAVVVVLVAFFGVNMSMRKDNPPSPSETATSKSPENDSDTKMVDSTTSTEKPSIAEQMDKSKTYTLDEVAMHATETDCWVVVDGKVHDMSSFVDRHPGGEAILQGCGKDASELFASRHGAKQRALLPNFEIGELRE